MKKLGLIWLSVACCLFLCVGCGNQRYHYKKDDKIRENLQAIYDGNGNGRVIDVRVQDSTVPAVPAVKKQTKPAVRRLKAGQSRAVSPDAGIAHLKRR